MEGCLHLPWEEQGLEGRWGGWLGELGRHLWWVRAGHTDSRPLQMVWMCYYRTQTFALSCSGPPGPRLYDLRGTASLQLSFLRECCKSVWLMNHPPGSMAEWPRVSFDPTEQQRVMLLSRSPSGPKKYFPIPVGHLEEEIRIRSADDCKRFREEFNVS